MVHIINLRTSLIAFLIMVINIPTWRQISSSDLALFPSSTFALIKRTGNSTSSAQEQDLHMNASCLLNETFMSSYRSIISNKVPFVACLRKCHFPHTHGGVRTHTHTDLIATVVEPLCTVAGLLSLIRICTTCIWL